MKNLIYKIISKLLGKNINSTPTEVILDQLNEPRPLPMGRIDFDQWSARIISGALLPGGKEDEKIFIESQTYALANMLLHLGPTESHKPDAFFIHSLRKFAVNQVADVIRKELHEAAKARTKAEEEAKERSMEEEASLEAAVKTLERADHITTIRSHGPTT